MSLGVFIGVICCGVQGGEFGAGFGLGEGVVVEFIDFHNGVVVGAGLVFLNLCLHLMWSFAFSAAWLAIRVSG